MANKRLETAVERAFRQPEEQQEIIAQMIERILSSAQKAPKLPPHLEVLLEQVIHDRQATLEYLEDK